MKRLRHQARIVALQGLYQLDMQRAPADADAASFVVPLLEEAGLVEEAAAYARTLAQGAWSNHARYDEMISAASNHWEVSRMAVVDRNILRLALYEIIEQPDVPARVVIDEAVEIGREFGEAETPHFINGVIDAIYKNNPVCRVARGERESADGNETERGDG
jgi:N utilization substance protein B